MKELRQIVKKKKETTVQGLKEERKRVEETRKRREINDLKSGQFQVVIIKWIRLKIHKKLRNGQEKLESCYKRFLLKFSIIKFKYKNVEFI